MHPHARKTMTYYTVTGHDTITVYNLTEGRAPYVVTTPDGRHWRRRGLVQELPEGFELGLGDYFLTTMTLDDAEALSFEITELGWDLDSELRRLYKTQDEMRAVVFGGLCAEISNHRAPFLCQYA